MRRGRFPGRSAALVAAVALVLCCAASAGLAVSDYPPTAFGPEGVAVERGVLLAPAPRADGATTAGVLCRRLTATFHIHVHLAVYVDGQPRPVPATIGLAGPTVRQTETGPMYFAHTCYYDLHTHAQDGVIHVEAPTADDYTLGQFFALWHQPLGPDRVGPATGRLTVYVNGRVTEGDPRDLVLHSRDEIQLDIGAVVAPQPVNWSHF